MPSLAPEPKMDSPEDLDVLRESLAETNTFLSTVLDHTHVLVVFLDPEFNFVWVNRAYAEFCEHEPEFFPGKNHFDLFPHEENEAIFREVIETGEPIFVTAQAFEPPDQPEKGFTYWNWSLIPVFNGAKGAAGLVLTVVNVTEQQRAAEVLANEQKMRTALIDHLPFIAMVLKTETREVVYCNEAARKMGAGPGTTCHETCMGRVDPCPFCLAEELWETGEPQKTEVKYDGKQFDCRWSPLSEDEYVHFILDITDQKDQEEELRDSRDRLREFGTRLDQVRDEERRALARELHDEVGQSLTAMRIDLRDLGKELPPGWENLEARIHSLIDISQDSVDRVNRMSSELRPPVLDLLGLEAAVESEIWVFQEKEDAELDLELEIGELTPHSERDTTAVRTLKEALLNIRRHARAARVKVSLRVVGEALFLEVMDDGVGIEREDILDHRSYGIVGMRERIERIGGHLQIGPRPEGGTRILAEIPLTPSHS